MKHNITNLILFAFLITKSFLAYACPCGCGSVNQSTLYPGENYRFQTSYSRMISDGIREQNGQRGVDDGPSFQNQLLLTAAAQPIDDLSLSIALPLESNHAKDGSSHQALSDPSFGAGYVLSRQNFVSFYLPQVDMGLSYKPKLAKSAHDDYELDQQIDVHSNGWQETFMNLGASWNMSQLLGSLRTGVIFRNKKQIPYGAYEKRVLSSSLGSRIETTLGYEWPGIAQVLVILSREKFEALYLENEKISHSGVIRHTLGITNQIRVGARQTLGLSYSAGGIFVFSQNTPVNQTFAVSFTQSV